MGRRIRLWKLRIRVYTNRIKNWIAFFFFGYKAHRELCHKFIDAVNNIKCITEIIIEIENELDKEKKARNEQSTRLRNKFKERYNVLANVLDNSLKEFNRISNDINKEQSDIREKLNKSRIDKKIESLEKLSVRSKEEYHAYLGSLKESVGRFKENDGAVQRLASLETRITLLEQGLSKKDLKVIER